MLKSEFWQLIDDSRKLAGGDAHAHVKTLGAALDELEPNDLISFQHWFDDYYQRANTWDLWGAAFIIGGGCSDDGFIDFRGWLVAQGEQVFEAAMTNPETLAKVVEPGQDCQVEGYTYAARWLWSQKTKKAFDAFPPSPLWTGSKETGGQSWEEDQLGKRFPKLTRKFTTA